MPSPTVAVRFPQPSERVVAFYTTRHGGISVSPFASLNCGFSSGDDPNAVQHNRGIALATNGLDPVTLTVGGQVHGTTVAFVGAQDRGKGGTSPGDVISETDGLLTNVAAIPIGVSTADCVPVFLSDVTQTVVGVVHAGWRGTLGGILHQAFTRLHKEWSIESGEIQVAFGPSICAGCFEIQADVADQAAAHPLTGDLLWRKNPTHWHLDLRGHLVAQCLDAGIPDHQIAGEAPCSKCENQDFFSHRAEGARSGRTLSVIALVNT